jgi:tRNA (guanosine-2'-O-)-methyltransferase
MPTPERLHKVQQLVARRQARVCLVIEHMTDMHNAQAIARSCDAFGIHDVHLIMDAERSFDPSWQGKRSSSSANRWLRYHRWDSTAACLAYLKKQSFRIVATAIDKRATSLQDITFGTDPIALVIGNERVGISDEVRQAADDLLYIEMQGMVDSFNVSVAGALCLYEITRQRRAAGEIPRFSDVEQAEIVQDLLSR